MSFIPKQAVTPFDAIRNIYNWMVDRWYRKPNQFQVPVATVQINNPVRLAAEGSAFILKKATGIVTVRFPNGESYVPAIDEFLRVGKFDFLDIFDTVAETVVICVGDFESNISPAATVNVTIPQPIEVEGPYLQGSTPTVASVQPVIDGMVQDNGNGTETVRTMTTLDGFSLNTESVDLYLNFPNNTQVRTTPTDPNDALRKSFDFLALTIQSSATPTGWDGALSFSVSNDNTAGVQIPASLLDAYGRSIPNPIPTGFQGTLYVLCAGFGNIASALSGSTIAPAVNFWGCHGDLPFQVSDGALKTQYTRLGFVPGSMSGVIIPGSSGTTITVLDIQVRISGTATNSTGSPDDTLDIPITDSIVGTLRVCEPRGMTIPAVGAAAIPGTIFTYNANIPDGGIALTIGSSLTTSISFISGASLATGVIDVDVYYTQG